MTWVVIYAAAGFAGAFLGTMAGGVTNVFFVRRGMRREVEKLSQSVRAARSGKRPID